LENGLGLYLFLVSLLKKGKIDDFVVYEHKARVFRFPVTACSVCLNRGIYASCWGDFRHPIGGSVCSVGKAKGVRVATVI